MGTGGYSTIMWVGGSLIVILSVIAAICGIIGLYLIHRVNRWNGYLLLVYTITVYQVIYDISYFFLPGFYIPAIYYVYTALNVFGGTAVTLWINVVSCVLLFTVVRLESFNVKKYYHFIGATIFFLSFSLAVITIYWYDSHPYNSLLDWVYFWVRVGSIIANVIVYVTVSLKLQGTALLFRRMWRSLWLCFCPSRMRYAVQTRSMKVGICCRPPGKLERKTMQATNTLLLLLITRLKYYPVVQIVTRSAATWWDVRYGFSSTTWSGSYTTEKQVSQFIYDITNPFAGIGFFLVLLYVQPSVYKEFYKILENSYWFPSCFLNCLSKPETVSLAKSSTQGNKSTKNSQSSHRKEKSSLFSRARISSSSVGSHYSEAAPSSQLYLNEQQLSNGHRNDSKASSSEASAFTNKGTDYDIQRDSNGLILAVNDPHSVTSLSPKLALPISLSADQVEEDNVQERMRNVSISLPTRLSSSTSVSTSSSFIIKDSAKSNSRHSSHKNYNKQFDDSTDVYSPYHASDIDNASTHSKSKANTTTASSSARSVHTTSQHSTQQLQALLQQAAPVAWSSDTPQSITAYLMADDDDEKVMDPKNNKKKSILASKKKILVHKRDQQTTRYYSGEYEKQRVLSSSLPRNMHFFGSTSLSSASSSMMTSRSNTSARSSGVAGTGGVGSERGSASTTTTGVLSIAQHPDEELAAISALDDDHIYENKAHHANDEEEGAVQEDDEEVEVERKAHPHAKDVSNRPGYYDEEANEMDNDNATAMMTQEDLDLDLDEDVVWDEIRRRIDELRTAYQQIMMQQQPQQQNIYEK